jgi:hypothetical protein
VFSTSPVPDRFLGNSNSDAASWFRSYERMFRSRSCQLICRFIPNNTLMPRHPYQLIPVMSGQLLYRLCYPSSYTLNWYVPILGYLEIYQTSNAKYHSNLFSNFGDSAYWKTRCSCCGFIYISWNNYILWWCYYMKIVIYKPGFFWSSKKLQN